MLEPKKMVSRGNAKSKSPKKSEKNLAETKSSNRFVRKPNPPR